jgi:hypothetical protein
MLKRKNMKEKGRSMWPRVKKEKRKTREVVYMKMRKKRRKKQVGMG